MINEPTEALINPSIPLVSAPMRDFLTLKDKLSETLHESQLICTDFSFCYYET